MTRDELLNMPDSKTQYSDWFGKGNLKEDLLNSETENNKAEFVLRDGYMLLIKLQDGSFVCTGYDSNEYHHTFTFD